MSNKPHNTPNPLLEDERKNPVYRLGQVVAGLGRRFGLGFLLGFPFLVELNPIQLQKSHKPS